MLLFAVFEFLTFFEEFWHFAARENVEILAASIRDSMRSGWRWFFNLGVYVLNPDGIVVANDLGGNNHLWTGTGCDEP